jgi:transcriptional regulator with XRE-family HTH domain
VARVVVTAEERVAMSLTRLRTEAGLTYEGLAQQLMGMGIRIHPSAIQKTEKSGRKASIKEMVAYARVFKVPVQSLWGGADDESNFSSVMRDLSAAERLLDIVQYVECEYSKLMANIGNEVESNPQLRRELVQDLQNALIVQIREERLSQATGLHVDIDITLPSFKDLDPHKIERILANELNESPSPRLAVLLGALFPKLHISRDVGGNSRDDVDGAEVWSDDEVETVAEEFKAWSRRTATVGDAPRHPAGASEPRKVPPTLEEELHAWPDGAALSDDALERLRQQVIADPNWHGFGGDEVDADEDDEQGRRTNASTPASRSETNEDAIREMQGGAPLSPEQFERLKHRAVADPDWNGDPNNDVK